jgi:hypothetical protein
MLLVALTYTHMSTVTWSPKLLRSETGEEKLTMEVVGDLSGSGFSRFTWNVDCVESGGGVEGGVGLEGGFGDSLNVGEDGVFWMVGGGGGGGELDGGCGNVGEDGLFLRVDDGGGAWVGGDKDGDGCCSVVGRGGELWVAGEKS